MPLTFLKNTGQFFDRMSSILGFSYVFSWLGSGANLMLLAEVPLKLSCALMTYWKTVFLWPCPYLPFWYCHLLPNNFGYLLDFWDLWGLDFFNQSSCLHMKLPALAAKTHCWNVSCCCYFFFSVIQHLFWLVLVRFFCPLFIWLCRVLVASCGSFVVVNGH